MIIYNAFGIKPTRNFAAAGIDFFVPKISSDKEETVREAFKKSFKITDDDLDMLKRVINDVREATPFNEEEGDFRVSESDYLNIAQFYFGFSSKTLEWIRTNINEYAAMYWFVKTKVNISYPNYLVCIEFEFGDMIKINSGIKVALKPHTSLEFKNKSGKGCEGWSVKACLVDEDYSGYVHLSMQYLGHKTSTIFVGDKLTQGVVSEVLTDDAEEVSDAEYVEFTKNYQRGEGAFGSSDVKH